jgi:3'-5' exoribonuclease
LTQREGKDATHAHIKDGAAKFVESAKFYDVDSSVIEQVEHCILSHHGFIKEWGSEVAPKTLEALILHQADMLSAHGGKTK